MSYTDAQKRAIKKWKDTHPDAYKLYITKSRIQYYHNHKDKINQNRRNLYIFNKQAEVFRNILISI